MAKKPYFSVIIPTYNRRSFLPIAVSSVLEQTFSDFELIVVDDGSTDNTAELFRPGLNRQKCIKYIHQPHQGVSAARNTGIRQTKGEYIAFLDSDDRFCREKLELTYDYIKNNPGYKIFHTDEVWYRSGSLLPQKNYHKKPSGLVFEQALKLCCVSPSTTVIKKEIFDDIGLFDEEFLACEDYDFWLRVTAQYPVYLIPKILTIKEGGRADQQSKKYPAMDKFRINSIRKLLSSNNLTEQQYLLAYKEFKNKCFIYIQGAKKRGKHKEIKYYKDLISKFSTYVRTT